MAKKKIVLNKKTVEFLNVSLKIGNGAPAGRPVMVRDELNLRALVDEATTMFSINPQPVRCRLVGKTVFTDDDVEMISVRGHKWVNYQDIVDGKVSL